MQPTLSDKKLSQKSFTTNVLSQLNNNSISSNSSNCENNETNETNEYELSSSYSKINDSFDSIQKDHL